MTKITPRAISELTPAMGYVLLIGKNPNPGPKTITLTGMRKPNGVIVDHTGGLISLSQINPAAFIEMPFDEDEALSAATPPLHTELERHYIEIHALAHTGGDAEAEARTLIRLKAALRKGPMLETASGPMANALREVTAYIESTDPKAMPSHAGLDGIRAATEGYVALDGIRAILAKHDKAALHAIMDAMEEEFFSISYGDLKPSEVVVRIMRAADAAPVIGAANAVRTIIKIDARLGETYSPEDPDDVLINDISSIISNCKRSREPAADTLRRINEVLARNLDDIGSEALF